MVSGDLQTTTEIEKSPVQAPGRQGKVRNSQDGAEPGRGGEQSPGKQGFSTGAFLYLDFEP